MADDTHELQASTTAWQIAMQEILRMVIRDHISYILHVRTAWSRGEPDLRELEEAWVGPQLVGILLRCCSMACRAVGPERNLFFSHNYRRHLRNAALDGNGGSR